MEGITLAHRDPSKRLEIPRQDRCLHLRHRAGDNLIRARLEERRGLHGGLHAGRAADALPGRADDEDERAHLGPVAARRDDAGQAVQAVGAGAAVPGDEAALQAAARGAGALPGDARQLRRGLRQRVEVRDRAHEGGEAGGGGGEPRGGGEVVHGDEAEGVGREGGEGGVGGFEGGAEGAQGGETGAGAGGGDFLRLGVEEEGVGGGEGGGAGGGGVGAEVGLGEGDGEGGVGGEVEGWVALAPVSLGGGGC